jgi:rod shape-determining protein MreC
MGGRLVGYGHRAPRIARRRALTFGILLLVSAGLMAVSSTAPVRELEQGLKFALAPAQDFVNGVGREIASITTAISEIDHLRQDNAALRAENQLLTVDNQRLQALGTENDQLAALLQIRRSLKYKTVAARVIGRDVAEVNRVVTIDAGSADGIALGDVVIGPGGALAGRVNAVGEHASTLVLISDPGSTVVGQIVSTRATGDVSGGLGDTLVMDKIDATQRVTIGDEVITAGITLSTGLRSPYPKGLVIGRVIDAQRDPNAVVQTAFVQPALDLDRLELVLVITSYEGGIPDPSDIASPSPSAPAGQ